MVDKLKKENAVIPASVEMTAEQIIQIKPN
jgi:hypothetical protein